MHLKQGVEDITHNANIWLQAAMLANVYISVIWGIIYGFYVLYNLQEMQDFYGRAIIIVYLITLLTEFYRLRAGYKGNLQAEISELSIFLATTPLIQLPLLVFLFLAVKGNWMVINITIELMLCLMCIEVIVGIWTWHIFTKHQSELHKVRCQNRQQLQNT
uniref:Transmembrane protein 17 n=1 Tax=Ceratitis capitata TaxID=7213 RepID=W8AS41_CERCA